MHLLVGEHEHTKLCGKQVVDPVQLLVRHSNLYSGAGLLGERVAPS
jgi:hypothetical protein